MFYIGNDRGLVSGVYIGYVNCESSISFKHISQLTMVREVVIIKGLSEHKSEMGELL